MSEWFPVQVLVQAFWCLLQGEQQGTFVMGVEILSHKAYTCLRRHCSPVSLSVWRNHNDKHSMYGRDKKIQLLCSLQREACTEYCHEKLHLPKCSWVSPDEKCLECDCIQRQELTRGKWLTQKGLLGWSSIPSDWCPYKKIRLKHREL